MSSAIYTEIWLSALARIFSFSDSLESGVPDDSDSVVDFGLRQIVSYLPRVNVRAILYSDVKLCFLLS